MLILNFIMDNSKRIAAELDEIYRVLVPVSPEYGYTRSSVCEMVSKAREMLRNCLDDSVFSDIAEDIEKWDRGLGEILDHMPEDAVAVLEPVKDVNHEIWLKVKEIEGPPSGVHVGYWGTPVRWVEPKKG